MKYRLAVWFVCFALTVVSPVFAHEVISVGNANWEQPWMPDLRQPGRQIPIPIDKRIDIVILGDGYLAAERADFQRDVVDWYNRFLEYEPWQRMRGAFRVRGVWTPSEERATLNQRSHYKQPATPDYAGDSGLQSRRAIFEALAAIDHNPARRDGLLTHTVVVMLIRNERRENPSGVARTIVSPDRSTALRAGFGSYTHHEFGHSYGGLWDEYIRGPGSVSTRQQPEAVCLHSVTNISYASEHSRIPWRHLMPGSEINPDTESAIGLLWPGGVDELGAWHSEPRCLMNGTHDNWDLSKTWRGEYLRDRDRFCFWCEEILVARTMQKTGLLGEADCGEQLWKTWEAMRPHYQKSFKVAERIKQVNAVNARERLHESRLAERPRPDHVVLTSAPAGNVPIIANEN